MLSIKVLGSGCSNCVRLENHAVLAVDILHTSYPDLEVTIEKITDPMKFMNYGLLATPGLVINEKLVTAGRIPTPEQIEEWLESALAGGESLL